MYKAVSAVNLNFDYIFFFAGKPWPEIKNAITKSQSGVREFLFFFAIFFGNWVFSEGSRVKFLCCKIDGGRKLDRVT